MSKPFLFLSNNPMLEEKYRKNKHIAVAFLPAVDFRDVIAQAGKYVEEGYHLMTHPLASNLKPMQCPYKSILLSSAREAFAKERDLEMIRLSLEKVDALTKGMTSPKWNEKTLLDFQTIDLSVVDSAVQSSLFRQMVENPYLTV